jgi:hypothetical protein
MHETLILLLLYTTRCTFIYNSPTVATIHGGRGAMGANDVNVDITDSNFITTRQMVTVDSGVDCIKSYFQNQPFV